MDVYNTLFTTFEICKESFDNISAVDSTNDTVNSEESIEEELTFAVKIFWTILFLTTIVVATAANLALIWIIVANKKMRTVTNYYLVNLAVVDTMMATLNVAVNLRPLIWSDWDMGVFLCKLSEFISVTTISVSMLTFLAISYDRYTAVINPFKPRMSKLITLAIVAVIWLCGIMFSMPNLIYFNTCLYNMTDGTLGYNAIYFIMLYTLPIISMTYTYTRVCVSLWRTESIGESNQSHLNNIMTKRKVVKMVMVVLIVFAICWLPFNVYFLLIACSIDVSGIPLQLYLVIYWLGMCNCMWNPLICFWMNSKFRDGFKQSFCCCSALTKETTKDHTTKLVELGSTSQTKDKHKSHVS